MGRRWCGSANEVCCGLRKRKRKTQLHLPPFLLLASHKLAYSLPAVFSAGDGYRACVGARHSLKERSALQQQLRISWSALSALVLASSSAFASASALRCAAVLERVGWWQAFWRAAGQTSHRSRVRSTGSHVRVGRPPPQRDQQGTSPAAPLSAGNTPHRRGRVHSE